MISRMSLARNMIAVSLCLSGTQALALFDAQVLAGKRWYKLEGDDSAKISSQELSVAAHLDPIPLVPVAFGLRATAGALTSDEVKSAYSMSKVDAAAVTSLGLDVLAWIPLVPVFTPYIRATIPVSATWGVKGDAAATVAGQSVYLPFAQTSSISGPELSLGAKFSLLPLIKFSVEVNQASQKIKPEEVKINNVKVSDAGETVNLKSNALLLGIEVGL